jgi:predicted CxxxxCH...CXXCH cytochrome family protein
MRNLRQRMFLVGLGAWMLLATGWFGCQSNPLGDGLAASGICNVCHGNADNAAPPKGINGVVDPTYPGVGLHQPHVRTGLLRQQGVACSECHIVPQKITDPGHLGTPPAPVVFGPLASAYGHTPTWDRTSGKCSNVYCHVSPVADGKIPEPIWTQPKTQEPACDMCHGYPPSAAPHTGQTNCNACHADTVLADGTINRTTDAHINGQVETSGAACTACHGSAANPAPPVDLLGNTQTTARGVGAHQTHLRTSNWHKQIVCSDCHTVPTTVTNHPRYSNGAPLPAALTWGSLATSNGASPSYDTNTVRCSNVYCHGSTVRGTGLNRSPQWTAVTAGIPCGSCHSIPPNANHPNETQCSECHPNIRSDRTFINPAGHINGTVEAEGDD